MSPLRFLDTNILLYSISQDPAEFQKREQAIRLIESQGNAVSVQILQDFYVQATLQTRPDAIPHEIAAGLIRSCLRFKIQDLTVSIMNGALEIKAEYGSCTLHASFGQKVRNPPASRAATLCLDRGFPEPCTNGPSSDRNMVFRPIPSAFPAQETGSPPAFQPLQTIQIKLVE